MTNSIIGGVTSKFGFISPHLVKQILATFASCLLSVTGGFTFGFTAVLLPQLKEDPVFPYDPSYDSWIASILPLAMMFGCLGSGPMSDWIGRRTGQIILVFPYTLGWFVMGLANNNAIMMLGRFITGICTGAIRPLGLVYIGEVSEPRLRSVTLLCPALGVYVGGFLSHTIGYYLPWRYASFVFGLPNILCLVILIFLKESPLWLISKGKIDEGVKSFKIFRGEGDVQDKELQLVLEKQKEKTESDFKNFYNIVFSKAFIKSLVAVFFLFVAVQLCGINTITFYSQDIFRSTFKGEIDEFMFMLITDVIRIVVTCFILVFGKKMPRKLTFVVACYGTIVTLLGLIAYLYFKPEGKLWIGIVCLIAYITVASALPCYSWPFIAEIFPSNVRGLGSGLSSLMSFSLLFLSVKVTPSIINNFGDIVMYASFAVVTIISAIVLTFILPETNGRSLQDIENSLYSKDKNPKEQNDNQKEQNDNHKEQTRV